MEQDLLDRWAETDTVLAPGSVRACLEFVRTTMEETADEPPQRSSMSGTIELIDPDETLDEPARHWLETHAARAAAELSLRGEVRVRLLRDDAMSAAHERYKGVTGPTDVLTFDLSDPGGVLDVDLMVCTDEAARRAGELGHDTRTEVLLYIVHGVLHCLGHDDLEEAESARMHAAEDAILESIGVGAVYAPNRKGLAS